MDPKQHKDDVVDDELGLINDPEPAPADEAIEDEGEPGGGNFA